MQIELAIPVALRLSVEEIEERLPSFRVDLSFTIEQQTSVFNYKNSDIWFECSSWDTFSKKLTYCKNSDNEAVLTDMSEKFSLNIVNRKNQLFFVIKVNKRSNLSGNLLCSYEVQIDEDILAKYEHTFNDFPKWW